MWTLEVEGKPDELYELLKQEFDKEVVTKEPYEFTVAGRGRSERTFTKERSAIDDVTSLQFRRVLKFVQTVAPDMSGTIKVTCEGDDGVLEVRIEEL